MNWWSNADGPGTSYARDELDTNYNLYVYAPDGAQLGYSGSYDNNYELVDFVATQTGSYRIRLYRSSADDNQEGSNEVGIAWVKDASYLPDIRNNPATGWYSWLVLRNGDAELDYLRLSYFRDDGSQPSKQHDTCALYPNELCSFDGPYTQLPTAYGSGISSRGESGAIVVENRCSSGLTNYTASLNSEGGMAPGTTLYVPAVKKAYYGRSGHLHIFNPSATSATVTPRFYEADTASVTTCANFILQPGARRTYHPSDCPGLASNKIYAVRLTATQPIVAVMTEDDDATHTRAATVNAFSSGARTLYVPVVKSDYYSNVSAIIAQNMTAYGTTVIVVFHDVDSGNSWATSYYLHPYSTHSFYVPDAVPANQIVSAVVSASQDIVATVYETKTTSGWYMQYNAFVVGSKVAELPRIMKNASMPERWRSGLLIQNTGNQTADVTVRYYNTGGGEITAAVETLGIAPNESGELYTNNNGALNNGFEGSAVVTSTQPVVVQVNVSTDRTGDAAMSYNGMTR